MNKQAGDSILVVNSGSSSLKFGLFQERDGEEGAIFRGGAEGIGNENGRLKIVDAGGGVLLHENCKVETQGEALQEILRGLANFSSDSPACVGHRVVHGGPHLREHQRITNGLIEKLKAAVHFAPLHIPTALALIEETGRLLRDLPQFACFDTAFHASMPESSRRFALPGEIYERGVERYGFHGLSYESIVHRLRGRMPERMICAHLGSGASLAAIRNGCSIDTSMGLTPTGGIPMATRAGDLDPGVLLFLMRAEKRTSEELEKILNHQSGLVALGGEADMQHLQERAKKGDNRAALAIEIFSTAVRKFIGAYAAALGGVDLLVFTGGIGEHSQDVRERICRGLEFLGIHSGDSGDISKVAVMASEEEAQIARHCRKLMRV